MEIEVLGAAGGQEAGSRLTSLLFNGVTALDAGSLAQALPVERQLRVRSVVLSHAHADHTFGMPFFLDNVFGCIEEPITISASAQTHHALRKNIFNQVIWVERALLPPLQMHVFGDEQTFELHGLRWTPIRVHHPVPTHGFLVQDEDASFLWSSDTGPTERIWEIANEVEDLKALAIDVSFENSLQSIADESGHLTPQALPRELDKLHCEVDVYVHHVKPTCAARVREEIEALGLERVSFLEQGRTYHL